MKAKKAMPRLRSDARAQAAASDVSTALGMLNSAIVEFGDPTLAREAFKDLAPKAVRMVRRNVIAEVYRESELEEWLEEHAEEE